MICNCKSNCWQISDFSTSGSAETDMHEELQEKPLKIYVRHESHAIGIKHWQTTHGESFGQSGKSMLPSALANLCFQSEASSKIVAHFWGISAAVCWPGPPVT